MFWMKKRYQRLKCVFILKNTNQKQPPCTSKRSESKKILSIYATKASYDFGQGINHFFQKICKHFVFQAQTINGKGISIRKC